METPASRDDGSWRSLPPQMGPDAGGAASSRRDDALERRLAAVEARLDDLEETIENAVAHACRKVVSEELRGMSDDLRRSVSELGRLLLKDLDRLTRVLAEHRDTIVDRLSGVGEGGVGEGGVERRPAEEPGPPREPEAGAEPTEDAPPAALAGEAGRWRVFPGRRRRRPVDP